VYCAAPGVEDSGVAAARDAAGGHAERVISALGERRAGHGLARRDAQPIALGMDVFHQAKADALADNAELSVFILAPDVALALSKAKQAIGSNMGLLEANGVGDGVTLAGVPVLVSPDVAAGNAWGLDGSQVFVVQRTGTKVVRSGDSAFDYDAVQVRATARVSFGFANPAGVVRLYDAA